MTECEVIVSPREVESKPDPSIEFTGAPDLEWRTPGLVLAKQISEIDQVRAIYEKVDAEGYTVSVLLDDDPEDVLDRVFTAEQSLYESFKEMPFDVRVMRRDPEWDVQPLEQSTVCRFLRVQ